MARTKWGRLPHGQLSQEPRAIKWREKKALEDAEWARENLPAGPGGHGGDPVGDNLIGVFGRTDRPPDQQDQTSGNQDQGQDDGPDTYICSNCREPVDRDTPSCLVCEKTLRWENVD